MSLCSSVVLSSEEEEEDDDDEDVAEGAANMSQSKSSGTAELVRKNQTLYKGRLTRLNSLFIHFWITSLARVVLRRRTRASERSRACMPAAWLFLPSHWPDRGQGQREDDGEYTETQKRRKKSQHWVSSFLIDESCFCAGDWERPGDPCQRWHMSTS